MKGHWKWYYLRTCCTHEVTHPAVLCTPELVLFIYKLDMKWNDIHLVQCLVPNKNSKSDSHPPVGWTESMTFLVPWDRCLSMNSFLRLLTSDFLTPWLAFPLPLSKSYASPIEINSQGDKRTLVFKGNISKQIRTNPLDECSHSC